MPEPPSNSASLPLQYVKGVGPRRAEALADEGLKEPRDLLRWVPHGYVDRAAVPSIAALFKQQQSKTIWSGKAQEVEAAQGEVSLVATIESVQERKMGKRRSMLTAIISDGSNVNAQLLFFNSVSYFKKVLEAGQSVLVSGKPEFDAKWNRLTFSHPEIERVDTDDERQLEAGGILPKYTLTQGMKNAGITMRILRNVIADVIEPALASETDILSDGLRRSEKLVDLKTALRELHFPTSHEAVQRARYRMKFEELFVFQMMLALRQRRRKQPESGLVMNPKSSHARSLVDGLPFDLTGAQKRVINEIIQDMSSGKPMNRLLQGDVGSGKTIVSLLCMLNVVDNGFQAAIMAPTEILAEQHARTIEKMLDGTGLTITTLIGKQKKARRNEVAEQIRTGEANIVVGTHALFEASIEYHKLGLIVIDEQHRFGVAQRAELRSLGKKSHGDDDRVPHILVMSATPIPRTLSMTLYGDLDVSIIDELPANRRPIHTSVVFESRLDHTHLFIKEQIAAGRQAYVVYPLVEKSEKLELKSAVEHFEKLQSETYPELSLGLLHGQMLWYEKEETMQAFLDKEHDILVATTVIEVGVDVPNATVMLIENAERFGLSQLHQLRGRVGRGAHQSFCFLATKDHFQYQMKNDRAKAAVRLKTMEETTDGFKIAEVDMRLRGPGDLMGTRQSGLPEFSFADIVNDGPIITRARASAQSLVEADPHLRATEQQPLRERLIAAFEQGYQSVA